MEWSLTGRRSRFEPLIRMFSAAAAKETGEQEEKAVERILQVYGNDLLRFAYSYVRNLADAQEIVQDTLIRYLKAQPRFAQARSEKAWLFKVAANLAKNRLGFVRGHPVDELKENLAAQQRPDLSFVWEAVGQLPRRYREVIHLFYQEGYSTAEIAQILGRKEATVRSDLHRAREALKKELQEHYEF